MRTINLPLEDEDYALLEKAKGERTWREFLLDVAAKEVEKYGKERKQGN